MTSTTLLDRNEGKVPISAGFDDITRQTRGKAPIRAEDALVSDRWPVWDSMHRGRIVAVHGFRLDGAHTAPTPPGRTQGRTQVEITEVVGRGTDTVHPVTR